MKLLISYYQPLWRLFNRLPLIICFFSLCSCQDDFLNEKPLAVVSTDILLSSKSGFENYITSLHEAARQEHARMNNTNWVMNFWNGTDVAVTGSSFEINFRNYGTYLTPTRSMVSNYWQWAYQIMLIRANTVITYAEKPNLQSIWANEAEKNAIVAEARFFRAYTHNLLANLYGGVPIVETLYTTPKTDFVRNTRKEVYESARKDLEFASKWLPVTVTKNNEGRIVKAAADHLLSEVYISLGEYDKGIESASKVINSGLYRLMTERFGSEKNLPGDVFSDLFKTGNQNRSSGNQESIYVWQFEDQTPGGLGVGNYLWRIWGPFYIQLSDPNGKTGMVLADSLSRGVSWSRPTTWFLYDLWKDNWSNDIRNSPHNIKRTFYYNNPSSAYFGQRIIPKPTVVDTMQNIYPAIRKIEGKKLATTSVPNGVTANDIMVFRLAETYLLRAEAYWRKGELQKAADDINAVRTRAKAKPILAGEVNLDYILDERARELIIEEPRRRTLTRVGRLVERTKKYTDYESTRTTIQSFHEFWPIPQIDIDANFSAKLEQNPGY